jgi:hypothetical protein
MGLRGFDYMRCDLLPPAAHRDAFALAHKIARDRQQTQQIPRNDQLLIDRLAMFA